MPANHARDHTMVKYRINAHARDHTLVPMYGNPFAGMAGSYNWPCPHPYTAIRRHTPVGAGHAREHAIIQPASMPMPANHARDHTMVKYRINAHGRDHTMVKYRINAHAREHTIIQPASMSTPWAELNSARALRVYFVHCVLFDATILIGRIHD